MPSTRHAILHIGVMKTATTTIQVWLGNNRDKIRQQGFYLPAAFAGTNHSRLAMLARHHHQRHMASMPAGSAAFLERLDTELRKLPRDVRTVILSGEIMSEGLRDPGLVASLKELLDPYFGSYTVVVYLRRQDQQATSMLSTLLRVGKASPKLLKNPLAGEPFDYEQLLTAWSDVFSAAAIQPRLFERASMLNGNIISDFAAAVGIEIQDDFSPLDKDLNLSLGPQGQTLLLRLFESARAKGIAKGRFEEALMRSAVRFVIDRRLEGRGILPSRTDAEAFYDKCRASNERVRATWFPERESLFQEDFSSYPEAATPQASTEELLEAALNVLLNLALRETAPKNAAARLQPAVG